MRFRHLICVVTSIAVLAISPILFAQSAPKTATPPAKADQQFDPRDLSGMWRGDDPRPGRHNADSVDQKIPEPPLTEWAKQHLLYKSISHDPLAGPHLPGWDRPGHECPNNQDPCFSADQYGVRVNDPDGEYPAKDCEPLSTPAMYD
jgi:hypothetical protein